MGVGGFARLWSDVDLFSASLERLQADRNRCAHPSLTSDDKAYTPSAELARLHLHSAVTHLLQHPPVQGKYALDRLTQEIDSDYFPSTAQDAQVAFASGPLRKPRESLVRNLVIVLTKSLLQDKPNDKRRMRLSAALVAVCPGQVFSNTQIGSQPLKPAQTQV